MRRFLFLPSGALLSALVFGCTDQPTTPVAPPELGSIDGASASAGGRPIDVTFTVDLPAGEFCAFAVRIEGSEKEKTIELPGDRTLLIFPGAIYTLTNLSNGNQVTFPFPGTIQVTTLENGDVELVSRGPNLIGQPFEPRFLVRTIGTFTQVFDSQGNLVQPLQGSGQLIDLCALLS
jgi:hypothetical protein